MEYYLLSGTVKRAANSFTEPFLRCSENFEDFLTGIFLSKLPTCEREELLNAHLQHRRKEGEVFCASLAAGDRVKEGCDAASMEGVEAAICRFSGKNADDNAVRNALSLLSEF